MDGSCVSDRAARLVRHLLLFVPFPDVPTDKYVGILAYAISNWARRKHVGMKKQNTVDIMLDSFRLAVATYEAMPFLRVRIVLFPYQLRGMMIHASPGRLDAGAVVESATTPAKHAAMY